VKHQRTKKNQEPKEKIEVGIVKWSEILLKPVFGNTPPVKVS
jgi:hypothetical protein